MAENRLMKINACGQVGWSQADLLDLIRTDPNKDLSGVFVLDPLKHNLGVTDTYSDLNIVHAWLETADPADMHEKMQSNWQMPTEFQQLDIAELLLSRCNDQAELQRMGQELLLYLDYGLLDLLRYLHYMVTVFQQHDIVMGVGRGSSVASFALYKIGVHQINSLYWDLDIAEFLK